ncbi:hypothetical protein JCM17846_05380 [Iodidimonas nitroreducens]|uniref:Ancillary SecYEG translocon subunit n=1 Tax=Iodidimonas nitroreducens TaxID=1236968 RepID=A0A5A7N754_9PROT|nr:tetratricopeptide repeat protein [Iodidimonas nitroreducens]GAK34045.1 hypothetical protein AQ1_01940 [alpha proteobacterium Q-1]GER02856.1 hypothetical protein JCM17846_05380 [Iodidimonas nitroreducens]
MAEESDIIFREVDEDVRRAQMLALWRKHGLSFVLAVVFIIAIVVGWQLWTNMRESALRDASDLFATSIEKAAQQAPEQAVASFAELTKDLDGGYELMAGLQHGSALLAANNPAEAALAYDQVAQKASDRHVQAFAAYLAASAKLKAGQLDEAEAQLQALAMPDQPLYYSASELLAIIQINLNDLDAARSTLASLTEDPATPPAMAARASELSALFDMGADETPADQQVPADRGTEIDTGSPVQ